MIISKNSVDLTLVKLILFIEILMWDHLLQVLLMFKVSLFEINYLFIFNNYFVLLNL